MADVRMHVCATTLGLCVLSYQRVAFQRLSGCHTEHWVRQLLPGRTEKPGRRIGHDPRSWVTGQRLAGQGTAAALHSWPKCCIPLPLFMVSRGISWFMVWYYGMVTNSHSSNISHHDLARRPTTFITTWNGFFQAVDHLQPIS
jgi:hypothetical protein